MIARKKLQRGIQQASILYCCLCKISEP
uniref:Uncharacterized protein n=1 Tax=Arundo donax TaxID=35708 RepID=A0A0A9AM22_ARUDO